MAVVRLGDGVVVESNERFDRSFAQSSGQATLASMAELFVEAAGWPEIQAALAAAAEFSAREFELRRGDGTACRCLIAGSLAGDNLARLVFVELSAEREPAPSIAGAKSRPEAFNRIKSSFLAALSHDLRTPLNSVVGFSQMLVELGDKEDTEAVREEYAQFIHESGCQLQALISDLIEYAESEKASVDSLEQEIDIAKAIGTALAVMSERTAGSNVRLGKNLPDALPALLADPRQFRQILHRLLASAIKATPPKGFVTIDAHFEAAGELVISISDTGPSLAPIAIVAAIELETRPGLSRGGPISSFGLSLALATSLVERNGGQLAVDAAPGGGTTVRISFPASRLVSRSSAPQSAN